MSPRLPSLLVLALTLAGAGCVPYAVGTTAAVGPRNEIVPSGTLSFVPVAIDTAAYGGAVSGGSLVYGDAAAHVGLSERVELDVRFPGLIGAVVAMKYRAVGDDSLGAGVALIGGAGVINGGHNAHLEATILVSGSERGMAVPYGGIRAMHTFPLVPDLEQDAPTLGAFLGVRLGHPDLGVSPEIGVFYDPSVTGLRENDIVVVPSVTVHGSDLLRIVTGVLFGGL